MVLMPVDPRAPMASLPASLGMAELDLPRPTRAWILPVALVVYVMFVTLTWRLPDQRGLPFPPIWFVTMLISITVWQRFRGSIGPIEATGIVVVSAMLLTDLTLFRTQAMRDLELYLKAGERFLEGAPVYMTAVLTERPADLSNYPFLYPPLTLPLFALLSLPPLPLVGALWTVVSIAAAIGAFYLLGIERRWWPLLLFWPPVLQGLYVGNVAVPLFFLFAAAPWVPGGLIPAVVFKLYNAVTALWLVREGRWMEIAVAGALLVAVAAVTAPIVPLSLWVEWIQGLGYYQQSQQILPNYLYGLGLGRYGLPLVLIAILGIVVILLALRGRDARERLSRLGLATVVASPSVFAHGFLVAVPSFLELRTTLLWLVLGVTAVSPGLAWWIAPVVAVAAWFRPDLRRQSGHDPWHPLGASARPWPTLAEGPRQLVPAGVPAPDSVHPST